MLLEHARHLSPKVTHVNKHIRNIRCEYGAQCRVYFKYVKSKNDIVMNPENLIFRPSIKNYYCDRRLT